MASTKIRGNSQIMEKTIDLGRLELDFLNGTTWDITNGNKNAGIRGVRLTPVYDDELASKYYVDSLASGLDWKESCRFATKADIGGTYSASGGPSGSGAFTGVDLTNSGEVDCGSATIAVGDRILVKNQTDAKQNGIYVVTSTGSSGGLVRASDHDGQPGSEVSGGNAVFIEAGPLYGKTGWVLQGDGALTLNTDELVWVQFSAVGAYVAGNAIDITGNVISVKYDNSSIGLDGSGKLTVKASGIKDSHIDWGTGSGQVSAVDVPIADSGNYFTTDNVEAALQEIGSAINGIGSFKTIDTPNGTDPVADSATDTLTIGSSDSSITITGNAAADSIDFVVAAGGIKDSHINWGTGSGQVSAVDMPIADSGNYFATDNVEAALQALAAATPGIGYTEVWGEAPTVTHNSPNVSLAHTPVSTSSVRVFLNGVRQKYTDDYTISGSTITFTFNLKTTPGQSDVVLVDYRY